MRDDNGATLSKVLVAAGVIAMQVGIDEKTHRVVGYGLDGRDDLVGERRILIVDEKRPVLTH